MNTLILLAEGSRTMIESEFKEMGKETIVTCDSCGANVYGKRNFLKQH